MYDTYWFQIRRIENLDLQHAYLNLLKWAPDRGCVLQVGTTRLWSNIGCCFHNVANMLVEFPVTSEVNPMIADRCLECDESTSGGRVSSLTLWSVSQLLEFLFIVRGVTDMACRL